MSRKDKLWQHSALFSNVKTDSYSSKTQGYDLLTIIIISSIWKNAKQNS